MNGPSILYTLRVDVFLNMLKRQLIEGCLLFKHTHAKVNDPHVTIPTSNV